MSDSTPAPREPKHTSYETLKELEVNRKRQIHRRGNKSFDIKLKVVEVSNKKGRLGDSTATINFIANDDVVLANEQTYVISGSLRVDDYKLTLVVEAAKPSETKISSVGTDSLSSQILDPNSVRPLVNIKALLENVIGQSFFAMLLNISKGEEKILAVLADSTGKIDAEIQLNKKHITQEVLNSLTENQTYLCSDVALQFTAENKLVVKFNYRSSISPAKLAIPTFGSLNLSENVYSQEQKDKLQEILQIKEKSEKVVSKREPRSQNKAAAPKKQEQRNKKPRSSPLPAHELVTIDKLEPWNNNQSFIGKILSVNAVQNNEYKNLTFLKGQVADSTGVIDFDFAQKNGQTLSVNDVVKFEKVMNKGKDGRHSQHYVEIKRFGSYTVLSDVKINSLNTANNMSTKDLPTRPEKPAGARPVQTEGVVKINQLVIGNNKQSTIGKILRVSEETRTTAKGQNLEHLVGQLADETGAIDFDIIKQGDSTFKVGDTVELDRVINRAVAGKHVVVLHLGKYTKTPQQQQQQQQNIRIKLIFMLNGGDFTIKTGNNQQSQGNNIHSNSDSRRQNNRSESNQEGHQHKRHEDSNNSNANPSSQNRTNGDDQRRQRNNENRNESNAQNNHGRQRAQGGQGEATYKPRNQSENTQGNQIRPRRDQGNHDSNEQQRAPLEYSKIKTLRPGTNGQNFIGKVFELKKITRELSGKTVTFLKGRVGDDSGNIAFDFSERFKVEIHKNDVVVFKNIMNKVDDNGYHFITIGKFGYAQLARNKNIGTVNTQEGDSNLSSIEYIKKTIAV